MCGRDSIEVGMYLACGAVEAPSSACNVSLAGRIALRRICGAAHMQRAEILDRVAEAAILTHRQARRAVRGSHHALLKRQRERDEQADLDRRLARVVHRQRERDRRCRRRLHVGETPSRPSVEREVEVGGERGVLGRQARERHGAAEAHRADAADQRRRVRAQRARARREPHADERLVDDGRLRGSGWRSVLNRPRPHAPISA
mmetsp:Transcript_31906/g.67139  ORF Transcript_31906/g.67139 Transcript_31906/m.67139 type:complete len:203 (-) Transcript_31906:568-1176(-)